MICWTYHSPPNKKLSEVGDLFVHFMILNFTLWPVHLRIPKQPNLSKENESAAIFAAVFPYIKPDNNGSQGLLQYKD